MITTSAEFLELLEDDSPEASKRVRHDEAPAAVWLEVLQTAPEHADAVILNKTLPDSVLRRLAGNDDARIRFGVVQKRRLGSDLLARLAADSDDGIRLAVAGHRNTSVETLEALTADPWERVREVAARRLQELTR